MSSRSLLDRPDDFAGQQVHVVYAVPKGGADQQFDLTSRIPYSLAAVNTWLQGQIGRKVKFDTYQGDLDITFVQLPRTNAEYDAGNKTFQIEVDLNPLRAVGKNLLVFYDGPGRPTFCGESTIPSGPFDRQFSVVYRDGCWTNPASTPTSAPGFSDFIAMHEMFHAFGALHPPQNTQRPPAISVEEYYELVCDLMYVYNENSCATGKYLDALHRFYYSPAGFADARVNTYYSPFLTPPPSK